MAPQGYDCCGWVTRNNLRCSDGRTILKDAFAHQDGEKVPLVWNHNHNDPEEVLGFTVLQNKPEGVYGYSFFNDTDKGQHARELVRHGDINQYSIFANHLKQNGSMVQHGVIKEVSLVLSGANPGACIEHVSFAHSDDEDEESAVICTGMLLDQQVAIQHSDEEENEVKHSDMDDTKTIAEVMDTLTEEQKNVVTYLVGKAKAEGEISHADTESSASDSGKTVADVLKTLNEDQKNAVAYIIGVVMSQGQGSGEPAVQHSDEDYYDEGEFDDMKANVFDGATETTHGYLSHSDMKGIIATAKRSSSGSLRDAFNSTLIDMELAHEDGDSGIEYSEDVQDYFVNDPSFLFPEARALNNPPEFIKRPMEWVSVVMGGTKHTPFSRVKSVFADITEDEARAKGYIKGNKKKEEVFTLLKRKTAPQTIYKLQKLDRDDELDITDFDPIPWLRAEMRMMLEEEIARAILVGDGRSTASDDHIKTDCIRPIWGDADLFTIYKTVTTGTPEQMAKDFIRMAIKSRKDYRGSGNPILLTTEDWLTEMILLTDETGRDLYKTEQELATKMRVSRIVTSPVLENLTKSGKTLMGIIVNLSDYNIGADKGGEVNWFEDFDLNFNKKEMLIETRISGALIKPYSAICIEAADANPSQG